MPNSFDPQGIVTEYARTLIRVKAKQLVRRPGFCRSDQDDIEQDLALHLLSQAQHFDPDRASLNTFIDRVVNSAVAMLVRERGRIKRRPAGDVEVQSLEEKVEQPDGPPEPLARLIDRLDLHRRLGIVSLTDAELFELVEDISHLINALPPQLQAVCRARMERNRSETEHDLDHSRRSLNAAMDVIRQHFDQVGFGEN